MGLETIEIDDDLLARVMRRHHLGTTREAVDYALRQLVADPLSRDEALAMRGSGWEASPGARPGSGPSDP